MVAPFVPCSVLNLVLGEVSNVPDRHLWATAPLILAHRGEAPGDAYTEHRKRRMAMLRGYGLNMLKDNRTLKRAIGIGIDASSKVTGRTGGSEDFYALEVDVWTPELEKLAEELKEDFGLLKPDNVTRATASVDEFPRMRHDSGLAPHQVRRLERALRHTIRRAKRRERRAGIRYYGANATSASSRPFPTFGACRTPSKLTPSTPPLTT
jgi:hypothetical protein